MRLIDADVLYERACELEAQALEYVGKIIHDDEKIEEWRKWSAILNERTAFKHDVYDAPTIEERKKGKWIDKSGDIEGAWNYCSVCGEQAIDLYDFCPNCGADMRGENDDIPDDIPIEYFESGGK